MKNPNFRPEDDIPHSNPTHWNTHKKTLLTKYLQNPFSITWLKLGIFIQWMTKMQVKEEIGNGDINGEIFQQDEFGGNWNNEDESSNWMDSVDPSLYCVIYSCQRWH